MAPKWTEGQAEGFVDRRDLFFHPGWVGGKQWTGPWPLQTMSSHGGLGLGRMAQLVGLKDGGGANIVATA